LICFKRLPYLQTKVQAVFFLLLFFSQLAAVDLIEHFQILFVVYFPFSDFEHVVTLLKVLLAFEHCSFLDLKRRNRAVFLFFTEMLDWIKRQT